MKTQKRISTKLLAVVLSVLMIVSIVPVGLFTAYASEPVTISVVDRENNGIAGVSVHIDTMVDETPVTIFTEDITTNSDGVADLSAVLEAYFSEHPGVSIAATATVSAEGYRQDGLLNVTITEDSTNLGTITLIKQYTLSVDCEKSDAGITIKKYGDNENTYASGTSFDAGTKLSVTIPNVENYKRTAKIGDSEIVLDNDNTYYLTLNENTVIDVTYTAVEYKVSVHYDPETGEVSPLEGPENDKHVMVDKTASGDIQLTLTPKEHYELKSILLGSDDVTADASGEGDVKTYTIIRDNIKDSTDLVITFGRKLYAVTYAADQENTGEIAVEGIEDGKVESETELTFAFTPEEGYALYKVEVNGENQTGAVELKNNGAAELKVKVLNDTNVKAYFEQIDKTALKDIASPGAVLKVEGYQHQGETDSVQKAEIYYALTDQELKLSANAKADALSAQNPAEGAKIYVYATVESQQQTESGSTLVSDKRTENVETLALEKNKDALVSDITLRFMAKQQVEENVYIDVIKTLLIPGTVKLIYDNNGPDINIEGIDFSKYINTRVEGNTFTVTDADSGVKEVTLTRSYQETQDQIVSLTNEGNTYSFNVEPIDDYTGDITYVINTVDNNGNTSSKDFTVKNDTQAPELAEGQAIQFDVKNVNAFARALNSITFGKWFKPYMEVTLDVTDAGVKFLSKNAYSTQDGTQGIEDENRPAAKIRLVRNDENSSEYGVYSAKIEDGKATVEIVGDFEEKPFTGTIFYWIEDALGNGYYADLNDDGQMEMDWQQCTKDNSNFGKDGTGIVMIENIAPTAVQKTDEESGELVENAIGDDTVKGKVIKQESKTIYNRDFESTYVISDANSGIYQFTVKVNGQTVFTKEKITASNINLQKEYLTVKATETDNEIVKEIEVTVNTKGLKDVEDNDVTSDDKGSYTVTIENVTDNSGNVAAKIKDEVVNVTRTVYVDRTAPQITKFKFDADYKFAQAKETPVAVFNDYGFFFLDNAIVTITAEDKKYDKEVAVGVKQMRVYLEDIEGTLYTLGEKGSDGVYALVKIDGTNVTEPATVETDSSVQLRIQSKFKGQIFAYAIDKLDNDPINSKVAEDTYEMLDNGYTNPDAAVVENLAKHSDEDHIQITTNAVPAEAAEYNAPTYDAKESNANEKTPNDSKIHLYNNKEVTYTINVKDTYSGIRKASYKVVAPFQTGSETVEKKCETNYSGEFESNDGWNIVSHDKNLVTEITTTVTIPYDCNNIKLVVAVYDNSGNFSKQKVLLSIDKTLPEITVKATPNTSARNNSFYNTSRQFLVTIKERNINPNEELTFAKLDFSKTSLAEKDKAELIRYKIGNFKTDKKVITATKANGEKYEYIQYTKLITIDEKSEGHYTFSAQATDLAKHATVKADLSKVDPVFTIDSTKPTITIKYTDDKLAGSNADYFHKRVATITIVEHNFAWSDVTSAPVPTMGGVAPTESRQDNGDTHILTLTYATDGHYAYSIKMIDKANNANSAVNYGNDQTWNKFVVDNKKPVITISGVKDNSFLNVNGDPTAANARINVNIKDEYDNFKNYNITLTRSNVITNGKTLRKEAVENMTYLLKGRHSGTSSSAVNIPIDIPADGNRLKNYDGIYTLTVKSADKAANKQDKQITFSVNRFGSVYALSQDLYDVVTTQNKYWKTEDLKGKALEVYEINPNKVTDFKVYLQNDSGETFQPSNNNYKVPQQSANANAWYQYTYRFSIDDFKTDGKYTFFVKSNDSTGFKKLKLDYRNDTQDPELSKYVVYNTSFHVDNAAPSIISINGIFDKQTYNDLPHKIEFEMSDIDTLKELQILVDGKEIAKWSAENGIFGVQSGYELTQEENTGKFTLSVGAEKLIRGSSFEIKAKDFANNVFSTADESFEDWLVNTVELVDSFNAKSYKATVSRNIFWLWYGNTVLFWSTIGGVAAVALAVFFIIFFRRLKKREALEGETK